MILDLLTLKRSYQYDNVEKDLIVYILYCHWYAYLHMHETRVWR
jgi:hypothetical protein